MISDLLEKTKDLEKENKTLKKAIETLKGIIYEEQTFNEVNKAENEKIRETLTRARFRLEEENQILRQQVERMKCCGNCKREKCNLQQDISVVKNCIGTDFGVWEFRYE